MCVRPTPGLRGVLLSFALFMVASSCRSVVPQKGATINIGRTVSHAVSAWSLESDCFVGFRTRSAVRRAFENDPDSVYQAAGESNTPSTRFRLDAIVYDYLYTLRDTIINSQLHPAALGPTLNCTPEITAKAVEDDPPIRYLGAFALVFQAPHGQLLVTSSRPCSFIMLDDGPEQSYTTRTFLVSAGVHRVDISEDLSSAKHCKSSRNVESNKVVRIDCSRFRNIQEGPDELSGLNHYLLPERKHVPSVCSCGFRGGVEAKIGQDTAAQDCHHQRIDVADSKDNREDQGRDLQENAE